MNIAERLKLVDNPGDARYVIADTLPSWLRVWWRWTERGVDGWSRDIWTVLGWAIACIGLCVVSPIALAGVTASAIVGHVRR